MMRMIRYLTLAVSEAPSSLVIGDLTEETLKEKLEKLKAEQNRLWGKNKRLTKELQDAEALVSLHEDQTKSLKHTVAELEKRLAKAEQECEEIKIDRNQIKLKLDSSAEVQQAVQQKLDTSEGRITQLRMQLAEKDRILAMQGNLSSGTEEARAELLRSQTNWMWEVDHTFPDIRVERQLRKQFATEASLVYKDMGIICGICAKGQEHRDTRPVS